MPHFPPNAYFCTMQPSEELKNHIETEIIPRYESFDAAHGTDHVRTVIAQSLDLARHYDVDADMIYAVAAYHDAVEDHRASSDHAPRTIYGRIVAEADRCIDPATVLRRTVQYGLSHCPALDREGHFERCLAHLRKKYAEGGYLRLWIPESDNARKQEELRVLIRDEARLRAAFDAVFDQETAR